MLHTYLGMKLIGKGMSYLTHKKILDKGQLYNPSYKNDEEQQC
ncbi:MAG: hypothetical protein JWP81_3776 [Ferruginibacter sp.]|nr:hypothetical protein [Ferruginibacter sp.]